MVTGVQTCALPIYKEQFGIWGGLAPRERLAVRRQRRINLGGDEEVA